MRWRRGHEVAGRLPSGSLVIIMFGRDSAGEDRAIVTFLPEQGSGSRVEMLRQLKDISDVIVGVPNERGFACYIPRRLFPRRVDDPIEALQILLSRGSQPSEPRKPPPQKPRVPRAKSPWDRFAPGERYVNVKIGGQSLVLELRSKFGWAALIIEGVGELPGSLLRSIEMVLREKVPVEQGEVFIAGNAVCLRWIMGKGLFPVDRPRDILREIAGWIGATPYMLEGRSWL